MAGERDENGIAGEGAPDGEPRASGGCILVSAILLCGILAALIAVAWLRSHHDTPNPAMSGRPPSLPAR